MEGRNRVIGLLYEAAISPSLWPEALAAFADLTQYRDAMLSVIDKRRGQPRLFLSGGRIYTPEAMRAYIAYYHTVDPLRKSSAVEAPAGAIQLCHEYVSREVAAKSELYQDHLIPLGGRYMGGWCLEHNEALIAVLSLHARNTPFERKKLARWNFMAQHAREAVSLGLQLAERISPAVMLRQAIDNEGIVCIMVDGNSKLIDCSAAGAALLARGCPLKAAGGGRLATVSESGTKRLRHLVALAAGGGGGGLMRAGAAADGGFCVIQVAPGGVSTDNPFDPRYAGCALIFVRQRRASRSVDIEQIRVALDCTRAEAEVAAALVRGHAPTRISADRGVTVATVRTQVQSLLNIAGVNRIPELISLLGNLR